ncbi:MAG: stage V sporulation protein AD [Eubacteriales bacterium]|nr:stage V sporulation protein AD [Eubacteriales bacterium]
MEHKQQGKQSVRFEHPPVISGHASVVGQKEGEGPYGSYFDVIEQDPKVGGQTWEEAEGKLQEKAAKLAIQHSGFTQDDIRYIVAGDLLGQLMASSFGLMTLQKPFFGVYGACSTMGESISLAAMLLDGGYADHILALTSSHFASAEKQFRFPLGYSNQRPKAATWTVTGSGGVVLSSPDKAKGKVVVRGITTGKIVDYGVKDTMNMGACMAPAAGDAIAAHFSDFKSSPEDYDRIITGDLGKVGKDILIDLLEAKGYDIRKQYMDCGIEIYDEEQQVQAGGSGCGCSAVMLTGYILKKLTSGEWQKVLFVPTGALLSVVSFNEGNSIPGIAHAVLLEHVDHCK